MGVNYSRLVAKAQRERDRILALTGRDTGSYMWQVAEEAEENNTGKDRFCNLAEAEKDIETVAEQYIGFVQSVLPKKEKIMTADRMAAALRVFDVGGELKCSKWDGIKTFHADDFPFCLGVSREQDDDGRPVIVYNLFEMRDGQEVDPYVNVNGAFALEDYASDEALNALAAAYNQYFV